MPNNSLRWEPSGNPIHRLIQLLDVLAIAFNRFQRRSFYLPIYDPPHPFDTASWQADCKRLRDEFDAVRAAIFPPLQRGSDLAPHYHTERLKNEAIAEFVRASAKDETTIAAVTNAADWLCLVGKPWEVGVPRPWDYGVCSSHNIDTYDATENREQRFDRELILLSQYFQLRCDLLSALALIGQTVPIEIERRMTLAHHGWSASGKAPITPEELFALVRETELSANTRADPIPDPFNTLSVPQPSPSTPTDVNPFRTLGHILHELFWLAVRARNKGENVCCHINPATVEWTTASARARQLAQTNGIPFTSYDAALTEAKEAVRELSQVACGNETVPFSALDQRFPLLEERLEELAQSTGSTILHADDLNLVNDSREPTREVATESTSCQEAEEGAGAIPGSLDRLTTRQVDVLGAMLMLNATGQTRRIRRVDVAQAINRNWDASNIARDLQRLSDLGYTANQTGPDGGVWLTPAGKRRAEALEADENDS